MENQSVNIENGGQGDRPPREQNCARLGNKYSHFNDIKFSIVQ